MPSEERHPWDNIGSEAEWISFVESKDDSGLFQVPSPSDLCNSSSSSTPDAIGRQILAQLYPDSKLSDRSVLYTFWSFGKILEYKIAGSRGPFLSIQPYKGDIRKDVPLRACRDYSLAVEAFKKVSFKTYTSACT
jgi:hypothetical protein